MFSRFIPDLKFRFVNVNDLSDEQRRDWNLIVDLSQEATIYHTIEWNGLQQQYTGIENRTAFAYWEDKPVGLFPIFRRVKNWFVSHACNAPLETPYGGPVTISEIPKDVKVEVIQQLVKGLAEVSSAMTFSFNTTLDFDVNILQKLDFEIGKGISSVLSLSAGEATVYRGMRRNHKRQLKKAESSGFKAIIDDDFRFLDEYYELLKVTYSRLGNKNLVNRKFYDICCKQLPRGWVRLFMIKNRGEFIAGGLVLAHKNSIIFWRGGALEEFLRFGASNLLYWTIIQWAIKNGYRMMDTLHSPSNSLSRFKEGFGCELRPSYPITKTSRRWQHLQRFRNIFNN